jgi:la-related protein 4
MSTESTTQETTNTSSTENVDLALIDAVRKQVEYYFSKENLTQDIYLQSQMDAQMSVPIAVVMKFSKLKHLTTDEAVVRLALQDSAVSIVNDRIKANIKASTRSTIILRDVPADTPEEEVREIFNYEGARPIVSLRSDIGDTWFVNFEGEEDAKTTLLDLRMKKRTFRGVSVKARIKAEQVVRSYFPVSVVPPPPAPIIGIPGGFPSFPILPPNPDMLLPFGFVVPPNMVMDGYAAVAVAASQVGSANTGFDGADATAEFQESDHAHEQDDAHNNSNNANKTGVKTSTGVKAGDKSAPSSAAAVVAGGVRKSASSSTASTGRKDSANTSGDRSKGGNSSNSNSSNNNRSSKGGSNASSNSNTNNSSARSGNKHDAQHGTAAAAVSGSTKASVELTNANFPPLFAGAADDNTPIPPTGYVGDYSKYTIDDVIMIVKSNVQDATLPAEVNASEHALAMQADPNLDLLKRQRTFTIDETREQLRQGRPVTSGLLFGSVDYRSLHYGDSDNTSASTGNNASSGHTLSSNAHASASFHQQLSTIEERNESMLNMSGDTLNASALEMSMMSLNESSFLEQPASTNTVGGSLSPARMNASSWAAMVKSAADHVSLVPAAATAATHTTSSATSKAKTGANQSSTNNNAASSAQNGEKKNKKNAGGSNAEKKSSDKKADKASNNSNKSAAGSAGGAKQSGRNKNGSQSSNQQHADGEKQDEEATEGPSAGAAGWCGKSSFASMLKQKADEEAAAVAGASTRPASTAAPVANKGNTAQRSNNNSSNNNNNNTSNFRRNERDEKKQIHEAGGMWAKETLPPLAKNPKAEALKSSDA